MSSKAAPVTSIGAAVALAILTLAVFVISSGRGPQSVIQRYHEALVNGDQAFLRGIYTEETGANTAGDLQQQVSMLFRASRSVQFGRVAAVGQRAQVDVIYDSQPFGLRAVQFALRKAPDGWRIDAGETLARTRESSLF